MSRTPQTTISAQPDPARRQISSGTDRELEEIANAILKEDADRELCRDCKEEARDAGDGDATPYGFETGHSVTEPQYENGRPVLDDEGNQLYVTYPEYECEAGHRWYRGEGMLRQTRGPNPILFEDHLDMRKRREIYVESGTPDPHTSFGKSRNGRTTRAEPGIFNRVYPEGGRKINTKEQRKSHGAGFYKG